VLNTPSLKTGIEQPSYDAAQGEAVAGRCDGTEWIGSGPDSSVSASRNDSGADGGTVRDALDHFPFFEYIVFPDDGNGDDDYVNTDVPNYISNKSDGLDHSFVDLVNNGSIFMDHPQWEAFFESAWQTESASDEYEWSPPTSQGTQGEMSQGPPAVVESDFSYSSAPVEVQPSPVLEPPTTRDPVIYRDRSARDTQRQPSEASMLPKEEPSPPAEIFECTQCARRPFPTREKLEYVGTFFFSYHKHLHSQDYLRTSASQLSSFSVLIHSVLRLHNDNTDGKTANTSVGTITATNATTQAANGCSTCLKTRIATTMPSTTQIRQSSFATSQAASTTMPQSLDISSKQSSIAIDIWAAASSTLLTMDDPTCRDDCLDDTLDQSLLFHGIGAWSGNEKIKYPLSLEVDFETPVATKPARPTPALPTLVRQPETRPISQEQLVAEVKGIYAGLVMVEGKCVQVDAKQAALARDAPLGTQPKLNNEQWQALIALHRTLLHEHHDFFLASQHPSATPAVRRLAIKYAMPARLWRHGIHSFLELLRNRLPESLDHMLAFIYLAYSMMTLLYESVPAFEETWIECLGDLGRYRMAIEDDDVRDREVWTQVARQWYLEASDRPPHIGRLYHHLAILARPNALQQKFYYYKAISVHQHFIAAKESILTLFESLFTGKDIPNSIFNSEYTLRRLLAITAYIKVHALAFMRNRRENYRIPLAGLDNITESHSSRIIQQYLEHGYYTAISNCLACLSFGLTDDSLWKALSASNELTSMQQGYITSAEGLQQIHEAVGANQERIRNPNILSFLHVTLLFVHELIGDPSILPFFHVALVVMLHILQSPTAMRLCEDAIPSESLVLLLNTLLRFYHPCKSFETELPIPEKNDFRPIPEDRLVRCLYWPEHYFEKQWFSNKAIEDENQYAEDTSRLSTPLLCFATRFARTLSRTLSTLRRRFILTSMDFTVFILQTAPR
jgi:Est1 DNA/RNA binding domain